VGGSQNSAVVALPQDLHLVASGSEIQERLGCDQGAEVPKRFWVSIAY